MLQLDVAFWSSLVKYLNNVEDGADGKHNVINSFFIWAWDANADMQFGLGGMVKLDYQTLHWPKLAILIDNSEQFTYWMGLEPWYLSGSITPTGRVTCFFSLPCFSSSSSYSSSS